MLLRRTIPAASFPVSLSEAKAQCRVEAAWTEEDALLNGIIAAATQAIGEYTGRVLAEETWACSMPTIVGDFTLPLRPVASITSITYYDSADVVQSVPVTDFYLFSDADRATLRPKAGVSWPTGGRREDAITITFVVGGGSVEPALKTAIKLMVEHLYDKRGAMTQNSDVEMPFGITSLVNLFRIGWVA